MDLEYTKDEVKKLKAERESMISDFQKKLDLISFLKEENERKDKLIESLKASESNLWHSSRESEEENRKLETQKIAFQRSYKQVHEENKELKRENERLKEVKQEKEQLEEAFQYQLEKRLEYFTKCQELKEENKELKDKLKD